MQQQTSNQQIKTLPGKHGWPAQRGSSGAMLAMSPQARAPYATWNEVPWNIPADNLAELQVWLYEQGMRVPYFKKMPVYTANVERLPWLQALWSLRIES